MWDLKPINKLFIFLYTKVHLLPVPDSVTCAAYLKIQIHCVTSIPLYSIVKKMSAKYPILSNHSLPISRPSRRTWGSRENAAAPAGISDIAHVRSPNTTLPFGVLRKCFVGTSHAVTLNNTKLVLESRFTAMNSCRFIRKLSTETTCQRRVWLRGKRVLLPPCSDTSSPTSADFAPSAQTAGECTGPTVC